VSRRRQRPRGAASPQWSAVDWTGSSAPKRRATESPCTTEAAFAPCRSWPRRRKYGCRCVRTRRQGQSCLSACRSQPLGGRSSPSTAAQRESAVQLSGLECSRQGPEHHRASLWPLPDAGAEPWPPHWADHRNHHRMSTSQQILQFPRGRRAPWRPTPGKYDLAQKENSGVTLDGGPGVH
jgi:hypothetical protein